MKLLLDTCVWGGVCNELQSAGHDVVWAGDWPEDPGDDEMLFIKKNGMALFADHLISGNILKL